MTSYVWLALVLKHGRVLKGFQRHFELTINGNTALLLTLLPLSTPRARSCAPAAAGKRHPPRKLLQLLSLAPAARCWGAGSSLGPPIKISLHLGEFSEGWQFSAWPYLPSFHPPLPAPFLSVTVPSSTPLLLANSLKRLNPNKQQANSESFSLARALSLLSTGVSTQLWILEAVCNRRFFRLWF